MQEDPDHMKVRRTIGNGLEMLVVVRQRLPDNQKLQHLNKLVILSSHIFTYINP